MTLEESTQRLTAAIEAEDFIAISKALDARAASIAEFGHSDPSPVSLAAGEKALRAGESAKLMLQALKQRTATESRRLSQIQESFVEILRRSRRSQVDYRG
jgi:hypothetical protein